MNVSLVTPTAGDRTSLDDDMVWSYPKFARLSRMHSTSSRSRALLEHRNSRSPRRILERVRGEAVGARYLRVARTAARCAAATSSRASTRMPARRAAILSYALWNRRFNADPTIVGRRSASIASRTSIIGIAPQFFKGLSGNADLFVPITARPAGRPDCKRSRTSSGSSRDARPGVTRRDRRRPRSRCSARASTTRSPTHSPGGTVGRHGAAARR